MSGDDAIGSPRVKRPWTKKVRAGLLVNVFAWFLLARFKHVFIIHLVQHTTTFAQEDDTVRGLVAKHGPTKWSEISQHLPDRVGKQCRERCV